MNHSSMTAIASPQQIQACIHQYFAASRSDAKAEQMAACFAEDGVSYDPVEGPARRGQAELRQFFQQIASLFSTIELYEEFISINGSKAAVKWRGQGVGQNGRSVHFEGIDVFEFNAAGQIQTLQAYWNPAAVLAEVS